MDDIGLSVPEFREVIQTIQRGQREAARAKKKWWKQIYVL